MFPEDVDFDEAVEDAIEDENMEYNMKGLLFDFDKGEFILSDGNPVVLEGEEAVKHWIHKNLKTRLYRYMIYNRNTPDVREYGSGVIPLLRGKRAPKVFAVAETERDITEMCLENPFISNIQNFQINVEGVVAYVSFDVILHDYRIIKIDEEVSVYELEEG